MSTSYVPVMWNRQKKRYDLIMGGLMLLYILLFVGLNLVLNPEITAETLMIRTTGSLAIFMLHVILAIGPLCRIDRRFLPLLYNRRHLGVTMFMVSLVHGFLSIFQFHALGDINPILSLFVSNMEYGSLVNFPFQTLGFFALIILFLMAATSHDFWLKNLSPRIWKALHMFVYLAYALVLMHVMLGIVQFESSPVLVLFLGAGMAVLIVLHLLAGYREYQKDRTKRDWKARALLL